MTELADPEREYEKDPKLKREDVEKLRLWAEKKPHLPKISELQFILFLQSCYYSNEQAKSAIENFFTIRTICKDIFNNANPNDPGIQMAIDTALVSILPNVAPSGYKVVFMKLLDTNPDRYNYLDQVKMFDMIMTLFMHQQGTNEGFHLVFDCEGSTFTHLLKFTPSVAKKYLFYLQEALPIRLRDIHVVNTPSWIDKGLALFKPMMKKELFEMIKLHPNFEAFSKVIPLKLLPKEYGGEVGPMKVLNDQTRTTLVNNAEFFKSQERQTTDESKRIEKSTDFNKIFGLEGTFKKLEVD